VRASTLFGGGALVFFDVNEHSMTILEIPFANAAKLSVLSAFVVGACIWDLRVRRIPDVLTSSAAIAGMALSLAEGGLNGAGWSLAGLIVGGGLFLPLVVWWEVGAGDMKMIAAAGTFLGPVGVIHGILIGTILGGFWALPWMIAKKDRKAYLPYAPPLAVGIVIAFFFVDR